jgi:Uma2 family endonuclease
VNPIPPLPEAAPPDRLVLHGVDWATYEKFLDAVGQRPVRMTYDGENLEIMAPSFNHESLKRRMAIVLPCVAGVFKVPFRGAGSATLRREGVMRGLEPDEGFYVGEHAAAMAGRDAIDLDRDPPPDLVFEVDISPSKLDRPAVYAALRVPEIWATDGKTLRFFRLDAGGKYLPAARSAYFPMLSPEAFLAFLRETWHASEFDLMQQAVEWARGLAPTPGTGEVAP